MFRRPNYVWLSLILLLGLIVFNLPSQSGAHLKLALGGLFLPLFGLSGATQNLVQLGTGAFESRRGLQQQIERLNQENQQLRLQVLQDQGIWQENVQLRQLLGWQRNGRWKLKSARVVSRDPSNWWRGLQLDVGSRDGVRKDLPVITSEGLVGRVVDAGYSHCQVALVGDPNCRVSALVAETQDNGIIAPGSAGVLDPLLVYLTNNNHVKPGQAVVTSGLGGVFPKGIPIGQIVFADSVGHGLYAEARVKLAANLSHLEYVTVILP